MWCYKSKSSDEFDRALQLFVRAKSSEVIGESDKRVLDEWKNEEPELFNSYQQLEILWDELGIYTAELTPQQITTYLERASGSSRSFSFISKPVIAIAASIVLVVTVLLGTNHFSNNEESYYQTSRGERMVVGLTDGSNIHLNTLTEINIRFNQSERIIELKRGEALFEVAHDPDRKFIVYTKHGSIQAVGTEFNVNVVSKDIQVTVLEGTILVRHGDEADKNANSEIAIEGEQLLLDSSGSIQSSITDNAGKVTAWTRGKLIFSGEPLSQAVEKVNLHSKHNITVKDKRLQDMSLFGVFNMGDTSGFISAVEEAFPVKSIDVSGDTTLLIYETGG